MTPPDQLLPLVLQVEAGHEEHQRHHAHRHRAQEHQVEYGGVDGGQGPIAVAAALLLIAVLRPPLIHGVERPVAEIAAAAALDGGGGRVGRQTGLAGEQTAAVVRWQAAVGALRHQAVRVAVVDLLGGGKAAGARGRRAGTVGPPIRTQTLAVAEQATA